MGRHILHADINDLDFIKRYGFPILYNEAMKTEHIYFNPENDDENPEDYARVREIRHWKYGNRDWQVVKLYAKSRPDKAVVWIRRFTNGTEVDYAYSEFPNGTSVSSILQKCKDEPDMFDWVK